ncbi:pyridoxamine 5'-phosphate oxidase family protein [Streptomyces sp. NPDC088400]|uniref:pyridoxamine 5'-phosphate oxidase family protein n=1 Tax=Streptomyces sp. NPDC088400 TaxID=3365861 RepID=UPI00380DBB01
MTNGVRSPSPDFLAFWRENHLCTLTTTRPDGSPHVVPVGVTYDPVAGVARVIANKNSRKVANILAASAGTGTDAEAGTEAGTGAGTEGATGSDGGGGARVAVCQVQRRRWSTLEGRATVRTEPEVVADAVSRYAERYERTPAPNPDRVVIEITVNRTLGRL